MTQLKCWRKDIQNKDTTIYRKNQDNSFKSSSVFIDSPSSTFTHTNRWVVKTYQGVHIDKVKSFKNEKSALKFAGSYMNKRDKC